MSASVTEILGVPNRENIAFKKPYYNPSNIGGAFPLQPILKDDSSASLCSFRVNYIKVELLKEQNPSEQSRLRIFLSKEILEGGMIRIHSAFVHDKSGQSGMEPRLDSF
ncbi:hypothetical protein Tco_0433254 [Tanacetum coccineum]